MDHNNQQQQRPNLISDWTAEVLKDELVAHQNNAELHSAYVRKLEEKLARVPTGQQHPSSDPNIRFLVQNALLRQQRALVQARAKLHRHLERLQTIQAEVEARES